jgi:hypothetical protein
LCIGLQQLCQVVAHHFLPLSYRTAAWGFSSAHMEGFGRLRFASERKQNICNPKHQSQLPRLLE